MNETNLNDLLCCPNCKYTEQEYQQNQKKWGGVNFAGWDNYKPFIYKDRLINEFVAECQNCGMSVIFPGEPIEIVIERWNKIAKAI